MAPVAAAMTKEKSEELSTYISVKIDDQVYPIVKAAASLAGLQVQDYLSDIANDIASRAIGRQPIKRRATKKRRSKKKEGGADGGV